MGADDEQPDVVPAVGGKRGRGPDVVVALAALVVLVIGAVVIARANRASDPVGVATAPTGTGAPTGSGTGTGTLPRLVPTWVPAGLAGARMIEGGDNPNVQSTGQSVRDLHAEILVPEGSTDIEHDAVVVFSVGVEPGPAGSVPVRQEPRTETGPDGLVSATATIGSTFSVGAMSRSHTSDELLSWVTALRAGTGGVDPGSYPAGFVVRGGADNIWFAVGATNLIGAGDGYALVYPPDPSTGLPAGGGLGTFFPTPSVALEVGSGTAADLEVLQWRSADDSEIDVNGHLAIAGSVGEGLGRRAELKSSQGSAPSTIPSNPDEPRARFVAWVQDGALVIVTTHEFDADITRRVAEGVQPVDGAGWTKFLSTTTTTTPTSTPAGRVEPVPSSLAPTISTTTCLTTPSSTLKCVDVVTPTTR